jgi:hypothetical protein
MKFEKKVARLLEEGNTPQQIIAQLVQQAGWVKVLLSISNLLVFRANALKDKDKKKAGMKQAKAVHKVMEEIEVDTKPTSV